MTRRNQHYPPELRERAVRMVAEVTPNYDSQWAAIGAVAQKLGVGSSETVRKWVRQAAVDAGQRPGTTSEESAEIKRLKREVAELRIRHGFETDPARREHETRTNAQVKLDRHVRRNENLQWWMCRVSTSAALSHDRLHLSCTCAVGVRHAGRNARCS
jgi:transposase